MNNKITHTSYVCSILYYNILYCTILHYIILYYIILYYIILYYIILYYIILYYIILYYIILYYIILHYIILYCINYIVLSMQYLTCWRYISKLLLSVLSDAKYLVTSAAFLSSRIPANDLYKVV